MTQISQTELHRPVEPPRSERARAEVAGASGIAEGLAAASTVVLTILALAGLLTHAFLAISCITAGVAMMFEGAAVTARASRVFGMTGETEQTQIEGGIAAEAIAGVAGVALGILALVGISPLVLPVVASIVFGGGLIFGSGARAKLNQMRPIAPSVSGQGTGTRIIHQSVFVSTGGEVLAGVGAIVLGILALLGTEPTTLTLVAFLAVGATLLLGGATIGARMLTLSHS